MDQKHMIQLIRSNDASLTRRLSALEELYELGTPEALLAVTHAAFTQSPDLVDRAHELIKQMGYTQCESLMNLLLQDRFNAYTRKRAFDLLRAEKPRELLRYVVQKADELTKEPAKCKLLSSWLRQTKLLHEWIRSMLLSPLKVSLQLATAVKKVDSTLPIAIARIVKNGNPQARLRAMDILGHIADSRDIVPFVISATVSDNAELRSKAILVLGRTSEKLSLVENALSDEDARVRANAVETLWGFDTDEARMLLRQAARDSNNRVRANAAKGLYQLRHPLGLQTFQEMLQMEDAKMRMSGAWGLGEVNALEAIPVLRQVLKDTSEEVQRNAALALEKLGVRLLRYSSHFRFLQEDVIQFKDSDVSAVSRFITAARALSQYPEQQLQNVCEDVIAVSPTFCQKVIKVLRQREEKQVNLALMMTGLFAKDNALRAKATEIVALTCQARTFFDISLEDDSAEVRIGVVAGLCKNFVPDAQELLSSCLIDPDPRVVVYAAQGLFELEDSRGVEVLAEKLLDPDPSVRICAIEAVGRSAINALFKQVTHLAEEDPEPIVRSCAVQVLEQMERAEEEAVLRSIRVHVEHIDLSDHPSIRCYASVLGEAGQVIRGLQHENFVLEETGIEQRDCKLTVAPSVVPIHVGFVMDYGDGMDPERISAMEQGVARIVEALSETSKASIIKYASNVSVIQEGTVEQDLLQKAIVEPYGSNTEDVALYDAILTGIEPMLLDNGLRVIVAFASSDDTCSEQSGMKLIRYAANHHVCIHVVHCDRASRQTKLEALPKATNGEYWALSSALSMTAVCRRIADILNYHYLLSYRTAPKAPMRGIATLGVGVNFRHFSSRMTVQLPKL